MQTATCVLPQIGYGGKEEEKEEEKSVPRARDSEEEKGAENEGILPVYILSDLWKVNTICER